jgi:electron transfer flavoprotein alpha subunit
MMSGGCDGNCSSGSCSGGSCSSDDDRLPPGMLSKYDLAQDTGLGALIWAERENNGISESSLRLISKMRKISDDRIFVMITGPADIKPLYDVLFSYGADTVYHIRSKQLEEYNSELYADALKDSAERINPMCILLPASERGNETAKLLSEKMEKSAEINCTDISMVSNRLHTEGSGLIPMFMKHGKLPIIATVITDTFDSVSENGRKGTVIYRTFTSSKT